MPTACFRTELSPYPVPVSPAHSGAQFALAAECNHSSKYCRIGSFIFEHSGNIQNLIDHSDIAASLQSIPTGYSQDDQSDLHHLRQTPWHVEQHPLHAADRHF